MSYLDRRQARDLDNYITGHYGEDQFRDEDEAPNEDDEKDWTQADNVPDLSDVDEDELESDVPDADFPDDGLFEDDEQEWEDE